MAAHAEHGRPDDTLEQLLDARYSCRGFKSDQIPRPTLERMFKMAQRTASWCNSQAWQVHLLSGGATDRFAKALTAAATNEPMRSDIPEPGEYRGAYLQRRRAAGFALYNSVGIARDDKVGRERQMLENYRFFGAPHVAVITSDSALGPYGLIDCGGYVSTLLLAAQSLGVAAIPQAAIAMYSDVVREHLQLSDDRTVMCAVSFGLADTSHPANGFRTERAPLSDVVTWLH